MPILDSSGKEIPEQPKPEEKLPPHKFGEFKLPADCHIKGVANVREEGGAVKFGS